MIGSTCCALPLAAIGAAVMVCGGCVSVSKSYPEKHHYALEVVRQLGKEMHPGEYPVRAREQGIGGTVQTFLHIGADGRIADVTVANSSGNDDLDHYVIGKLAKLRLPQVPGEFRGRAFTVYVPVKFAVRKN